VTDVTGLSTSVAVVGAVKFSQHTVKFNVGRMFELLKVTNRTELARKATRERSNR
jgi:DNA-binding NarL/FixJ family response regulator